MSCNLDHLVRREREAEVVQRHVRQFLEDVPGIGALQAQHPHLLAPILQGDVEAGILNRGLNVGKVLIGGAASSSNVEAAAFKGRISAGASSRADDGDGEVGFDARAVDLMYRQQDLTNYTLVPLQTAFFIFLGI